MAETWVCPAGHSGGERLPLPTCPVCGLPVDYPPAAKAPPKVVAPTAAALDETLAGSPPAPSRDLQDLVFLQQQPPPRTDRVRFSPPEPPAIPPTMPPAIEQTLDPNSRPSRGGNSSVLSWVPASVALSEPSQDDTMQRPGDPSSQSGAAPSVPLTHSLADHGETMVRPSAQQTASPTDPGDAACALMLSGYDVLGVLGRGGMGVVYKARQRGLNRVVALKMILHGSHATTEDLVRFKIEAEAVAKLRHPNIVQIFDTGERDGKPFFSLEYLEGGSLQGRLKGEPLAPRAAATLLETLSRAVDHAHRHGIVHRDLKPANVLLAEPPPTPVERCTPKITDFGLAKRLEAEDQGATNTEAILGTPTYMAPEQASNSKDVGPAADLYALGAILYDLLTGRPPFKGTTVLDTLQMVQKAEPVAPVALNSKIPRDLQTICLKCLEKEPHRRYKSAEALADDLRAFLDGRPIKARAVGRVERTWKWARRNPTLAALVVLSVVAPLAVAGASAYAAVVVAAKNIQLKAEKDTVERQNKELDEGAKKLTASLDGEREARKKADEARDAARRSEDEAHDAFLRAQSAVGELIRLAQTLLRNEPGSEARRKALLKDAVRVCAPFVDRPGANPSSRVRAARAFRILADLQARLGENAEAERSIGQALGLYQGLIDEGKSHVAGANLEDEVTETKAQRGGMLERRDPKQAAQLLEQTLARLERLPPAEAGRPTARRNLAALLCGRAVNSQRQAAQGREHFDRAEADYDRAAKLLGELLERPRAAVEDDVRRSARLELSRLEVNRAALYRAGPPGQDADEQAKNLAKGEQAGRRAVASLKAMLKDDDQDVDAANELGRGYANLGLVLLAQRKPAEEKSVSDEAIRLFADVSRKFGLYVDFKHLLAIALYNQGTSLTSQGSNGSAREPLARSRQLLEDLVKGHSDVATYRGDLARVCINQGVLMLARQEPAEALEPLGRAAKLLEEAALEGDAEAAADLATVEQNLMRGHTQLARAAYDKQDWAAAEPQMEAMASLCEKRVKALSLLPATATPLERAGRAGEALLARADLVGTLRSLADVKRTREDHKGAAAVVRRARPYLAKSSPAWLEAARLLCRCIDSAEADEKLNDAGKARAVGEYARLAMDLLDGAVAAKSPELAAALDAPDLAALRTLPAFEEEYNRLRARAGKKS